MHEIDFMKRAIRLSEEMMFTDNAGPFGAVIVKEDKIIAEGYNQVTGRNDPTAHAEIVAIRAACEVLDSFSLRGTQIYASCEPCPMCLSAIHWARIERIYFSNSRADARRIGFDDEELYDQLKQAVGDRRLPTVQLIPGEGLSAFEAWQAKTDKTPY